MVLKKIKKIKEVMSYVGKKLRKKKPVVKKSKNPYNLADWKQGIKYGKGGFAKAIQIAEQQGIIKKTNTATGTAAAAGLSGLTEEELRRLRGYSKGGAIKKGLTIIVDSKGKAKIKASVKQVTERAEKELEDFIKNLNPKKFQSGGILKILKKIEGRYGKVDDIRRIYKDKHIKAQKLLKKIKATDEYKSYQDYKKRKAGLAKVNKFRKRQELLKKGKPIPKELQATKPSEWHKARGKPVFNEGGLVKPKSVRIAKRGWGKAIR